MHLFINNLLQRAWISSLFIVLALTFSTSSYAVGPQAGEYFYRADTRSPHEIFGVGQPGTGFPTWAASRGVPADNNIIQYLGGLTVRPSPIEHRNAGWVSVSGNLQAVENFLQTEIVPPARIAPMPMGQQTQWIYQISPSSDAYSVNWMLVDALQRIGPTDRARWDLNSFLAFSDEDEWIVRGGIPAQHIYAARRFEFDIENRRFEQTSDIVYNPHYSQPPIPAPQTNNVILTNDVPTTIYGYQDYQSSTVNATTVLPAPYSSSCAGVGPSSGPSNSFQSAAPGCDLSTDVLKTIDLANRQTILSQLVITAGYCLQPVNNVTKAAIWTRSYLWANNCDENDSAQKAYYDIAGRIVFPADKDGIQVCLTAPENVIAGNTKWDYVQFWPCDVMNPYQTWIIRQGKLHPSLKPELNIRFNNKWYGMISDNNQYGSAESLSPNKMTDGFFKSPSLPRYGTREIGISWGGISGDAYYPAPSRYSESYSNRTYYNMVTKQLSMLSYGTTIFPGVSVKRYWKCLASRQAHGDSKWKSQWAYWTKCNDSALEQRWTIDDNSHAHNGNPIENIRFKDAAGNYLYFNLHNTLNYGYPYTQKGTAGWGSSLNIYRSYKACSKSLYWEYCLKPKHSYQENDGIW
ncbi:DUF1561 family protein [Shewanella schlegeliana]|uniref:DUF1561 family protein n=1 Tax=Shewanella schlegeliana TaxID=190308 RepID=A0ABS1T4K6_9GAMM|nr:DUF1561 family protein [Shewanella schlegeliana]MBL4914436.1 DUF1561 family protein [Shewanella schlegeliana]MCL1109340.1 DUF1561 family protein [Shewanella schlegeliana]